MHCYKNLNQQTNNIDGKKINKQTITLKVYNLKITILKLYQNFT